MTLATSVASSAPGAERSSRRSPETERLRFASNVATRRASSSDSARTGADVSSEASAVEIFDTEPAGRQIFSLDDDSSTAARLGVAKTNAKHPAVAAMSAVFCTPKRRRYLCMSASLGMKPHE